MKHIWLLVIPFILNSSAKKVFKEAAVQDLTCETVCLRKGLYCLGVLEKKIYDGTEETDKVIFEETTPVCLLYRWKIDPT